MSRSLRSRPLTLYEGAPSIPPAPSSDDIPDVPSRSTSANTPTTPSSGARFKKASQVGSNLKKRLSTRYGDDQRNSRIPMGADMLSSLPSLPSAYAGQNQHSAGYSAQYTGGSSYPSSAQRPESGRQSGYQQHSLDDETDETGLAAASPLSAAAYNIDGYGAGSPHASTSSNTAGRGIASVHSQANRHLQPHSHVPHHRSSGGGSPSSAAARPKGASSSSSRGPAVAWDGSSLQNVLESNRRHGLEDVVDLESLMVREAFDGTEYLRIHLPPTMAPATFSQSLDKTKAAVKADIKAQVFDHYSDFIAISSQVSALENEMIELKSLLAEWRSMPRTLEREDENGKSLVSSVNALSKRNSLLSLQQVYRAQLTSLWEGITNSQKFIPYKPGRHLIAEAPDFVELNSATYRPTSNVALFLLDDLLLVASRKKGRMSTKVKLEAERCFALGEIVVVDLKDSVSSKGGSGIDVGGAGGIKDSIKIKRGKETFVYKAERPESKRALLNAFRRVAEELANRKKKESSRGALEADQGTASTDSRRQSIYAGMSFDKAVSKARSILPDLAEEDAAGEEGVMKLATERIREERKDPNRWLNDWSDGLAVDIALRRWGDACEKVGKGKAVLSTYTPADPMHPVLSARLSTHTAALVSALLLALKSTTLRKSSLVSLSAHLSALGYSSIARQTFLSAREDLLRRRKRSIKYEGDAELYVAELSMVVFGMVRNTSEWFMAAWKETGMASGFVKWALSQIHSFALTFRRQVYGNVHSSMMITAASGPGSHVPGLGASTRSGVNAHSNATSYDRETARRARRVALESAQQLKDVGLDFGFVLNELLRSEEEQLLMQSTPGVHARIEEIQNDEGASSAHQPSTASSYAPADGGSSGGSSGGGTASTGHSSRPSMTKSGSSGSITSTSGGGSGSGPAMRRKMSSSSLSSSRSGGVLDRVAQFEQPSSAPSASQGSPSRRRGSSSDSTSASGSTPPPGTGTGGSSTPPLRLNTLGRKRSLRGAGAGAASPPPVPPIPSLTLTLADEASGISHRISSADLPNVTAQEIRRRSRLEMLGGSGSPGSGGRTRDRDRDRDRDREEALDRVAE